MIGAVVRIGYPVFSRYGGVCSPPNEIPRHSRTFTQSGDEEFPAAISRLIEVEESLRWFAIQEILSNQEGGLHRDTGDDYFLYRPPGGRFVLLPWDMDSTFLVPRQPIFRPSLPAVRRLLSHLVFAPSRAFWLK